MGLRPLLGAAALFILVLLPAGVLAGASEPGAFSQSHPAGPWYDACGKLVDLALAGFLAGLLVSLPALAKSFSSLRRHAWIVLLGGVAFSAWAIRPLAAPGVWYSNNHGIRILADLRDGAPWPSLSETHGLVYYEVMRLAAGLGGWGPIEVNGALAASSGVAAFLLVFLLFKSELAALVCWLLVSLAPLELRLGASEVHFVLAQLLLVLALLFLVLYLREGRRACLALGLGALFLLMQTRAEWMLLGPAVAALSVLTQAGTFPRTRLWGRFPVLAAALFAALSLPWLANTLSLGGARVGGAFDARRLWNFPHPLAFARIPDAFFNPDWTPLVYPACLVVGVVAAVALRSRGALLLLANALLIGWIYSGYHENRSTYTRVSLMTLVLYCGVAGLGAAHAAEFFRRRARLLFGFLLPSVALFALSYGPCASVLTRRYAGQVEHALLEKAHAWVPAGSTVVFLTDEDAPEGVSQSTHYLERDYLALFLRWTDGSRKACGIRSFVGRGGPVRPGRDFYFQGSPCHRPAWPRGGQEPSGEGADKAYLDPACRLMAERFALKPVFVERISPEPDPLGFPWENPAGPERPIGLYEIESVRPPGPKEPSPAPPL